MSELQIKEIIHIIFTIKPIDFLLLDMMPDFL